MVAEPATLTRGSPVRLSSTVSSPSAPVVCTRELPPPVAKVPPDAVRLKVVGCLKNDASGGRDPTRRARRREQPALHLRGDGHRIGSER